MIDEQILSGHVIHINRENISVIPEIIISTIQLQKGQEMKKILEQWDPINRPIVKAAIQQLSLVSDESDIRL